jgi:hypothetical protein
MTNSQRLLTVRSAIEGYLSNQVEKTGGETAIDAAITSESILIRQEHYCGRRFRTDTHQAVWFIEEDQIKISTSGNQWCVSLQGQEIDAMAEASSDSSQHIISMPVPSESDQQDSAARRAA